MQNSNKIVTINSRKYDGSIHKSWNANLIQQRDSLLVFLGKFEKEVKHSHLGVIRPETLSYEYYWLIDWFNVFRFHEPDGSFRNFYCNLNMPPSFEENVLDYVDLDIDVLIWKDFSIEILDLDEFEENAEKYNYPAEVKNKTAESLKKIIELVRKREFPFDYEI